MGVSATFSVVAQGAALSYQWKVNGTAIPGAVNASYQIPATTFSESGTAYTVTVTNSGGTMDSAPATLTVTARAPKAGDLRFQQVDAPSTVNGWGNAGTPVSTLLISRGGMYFSPAVGTPFAVGGGSNWDCGTAPTPPGEGCDWAFSEFPLAASSGSAGLLTGYASDFYDDFQADLQSATWPAFGNGISPASGGAVITSLDIEPAQDLFALSWVQTNTQTGFDLQVVTLAPQGLQAAATQEGLNSRVITAIAANGAQVTYFSYGWQGDTTTLYDSQIVTATPADAVAAATNLAAEGYIITATGPADTTGNIFLVGTRVQGDSMPRPFVTATDKQSATSYMQQGYALVGIILNSQSVNLQER
jgi:hypothetical protein